MTKGGLFSYLRAYLTHITPYKLFIRLFFVEKQKLVVHPRKNVQRVFCYLYWEFWHALPWRMPSVLLVQLRPLHPLMFVPNRSLEWVLRVLWELTSALWKFLKKTLWPSAKPLANIVQVSAAKKFILEKWKSCFEVKKGESRTKDNKIWGFLVEKHRKTKLFVRLYMVIAMLLHGKSYAFTW